MKSAQLTEIIQNELGADGITGGGQAREIGVKFSEPRDKCAQIIRVVDVVDQRLSSRYRIFKIVLDGGEIRRTQKEIPDFTAVKQTNAVHENIEPQLYVVRTDPAVGDRRGRSGGLETRDLHPRLRQQPGYVVARNRLERVLALDNENGRINCRTDQEDGKGDEQQAQAIRAREQGVLRLGVAPPFHRWKADHTTVIRDSCQAERP